MTVVVVMVASLAAARAAHATTWCVKDPACPAGGNSSQSTISGAVTAAATTGDTVLIGPGTFLESISTAGKSIDFTGAGSARTIIQSPTPGSATFSAATGGTIRDLGITLPAGAGSGRGLFFNGTAERVAVTAPPGTTTGTGVIELGGTFDDGSVILPTGPGTSTVGVSSFIAPGGAVQDSTIVASRGVVSALTLRRDRILATQAVDTNNSGPAGGTSVAFTIDDTAIETVPGGSAEIGINADEGSALSGGTGVSVTVTHSTVVGSGAAGTVGLDASATATTSPISVLGALSDSIVRGYSTAIRRTATGGTGNTAHADLTSDTSDFNGTAVTSTNNGNPVGTGTFTPGAHDVDTDPQFVTTTFTDPRAFRLLATSPLIDAGADFLGPGESSTDLAGNPRLVAAFVFGTRFSDIGALEFQPHAPSVTVSGPRSTVVGRSVSFAAHASDPDPGDTQSFTWRFDDGTTAAGAAVSHAFAHPGRHSVAVTVTDHALLSASATTVITVVGRPAITHAAVSGGRLTYRDVAAASTTITIQRSVSGVRRHRRCVRATRPVPARARCTFFTTTGRLTHADTAGKNTAVLRLHGHALAPGSYRVKITARNAAGSAKAVLVRFRVHG